MLNQPALKIGQNLRMAELEGEHFNGMLFIIFSGCSPLAAQSACLKMTFFQWSRPFHTILAWFLTYHLEVFMAYIYIFWHSIWHYLASIPAFCLASILKFFLASILTFFLASIGTFFLASIGTFFLASILAFILACYLASILTFFLASIPTFYLASILIFYLA